MQVRRIRAGKKRGPQPLGQIIWTKVVYCNGFAPWGRWMEGKGHRLLLRPGGGPLHPPGPQLDPPQNQALSQSISQQWCFVQKLIPRPPAQVPPRTDRTPPPRGVFHVKKKPLPEGAGARGQGGGTRQAGATGRRVGHHQLRAAEARHVPHRPALVPRRRRQRREEGRGVRGDGLGRRTEPPPMSLFRPLLQLCYFCCNTLRAGET